MMEENTQEGNPEITAGSAEDFFTALEDSVNGVISDDVFEETPQQVDSNTGQNQPETVSNEARSNSEDEPKNELGKMKKRYSDSSREAQKMKAQLDELKPFIPVLDAMKKDSGLVEHMRSYLLSGGDVPANVIEKFLMPW